MIFAIKVMGTIASQLKALYFFDFLPLKIFTGHNIENSSEKSRVWRHGNPFDSNGHTSLITPEHSKQKSCTKIHIDDLKTMGCGQDAINRC